MPTQFFQCTIKDTVVFWGACSCRLFQRTYSFSFPPSIWCLIFLFQMSKSYFYCAILFYFYIYLSLSMYYNYITDYSIKFGLRRIRNHSNVIINKRFDFGFFFIINISFVFLVLKGSLFNQKKKESYWMNKQIGNCGVINRHKKRVELKEKNYKLSTI